MTPWLIAAPAVAVGLAGVTAYAAVQPRAQLFGPTLWRTSQPDKLALTFDDGPNPALTPKLLDLLDRHRAKATFFLVGKYVRESPGLVKEMAARGHVLGNHTETHPNLFFCGSAETRDELLRCSEAIHQAAWEKPRWFRPPFGFRGPWTIAIALRLGMPTVMWSLIPGDWRQKSPDWLIDRMKPIAARAQAKSFQTPSSGDVLCLHDGDYARPNADRARTLAALEFWLPRWSDLGLKFVTISQAAGKVVEG